MFAERWSAYASRAVRTGAPSCDITGTAAPADLSEQLIIELRSGCRDSARVADGASVTLGLMPGERFSAELWSGIEEVYHSILAHPFLAGLTDGSLDRSLFQFYVVQDAHYLREYARALSIAAARAPTEPDIAMFNRHAEGAVAVERSLHESFFANLGVSTEEVADTPLAPTNLAYTSYLLATAYSATFAELLGAVLPCYWIYWEVGKALSERGSPDPLYARWIETYGGEEFAEIVRAVLTLTDRIGPELTPAQRQRAARHFITTSRYEWMFWEMGYRCEQWPI